MLLHFPGSLRVRWFEKSANIGPRGPHSGVWARWRRQDTVHQCLFGDIKRSSRSAYHQPTDHSGSGSRNGTIPVCPFSESRDRMRVSHAAGNDRFGSIGHRTVSRRCGCVRPRIAHAMLRGMQSVEGGGSVLPFVRQFHGGPSSFCRGIISYTSYSRTNDCIYNGYDTAYTFTHNNINLEPNTMNNIDTVAHMNMHYTQY